jgi:hypothetical protein
MKKVLLVVLGVLLSGCASYVKLNVESKGASDVPIAVSPSDVIWRGDGNTAFQRIYKKGTAVTLKAPAVANKGFDGWTYSTTKNPDVTVMVVSDMDMAACYTNSTPTNPPTPQFIVGDKRDEGVECWGSVDGLGLRFDCNDKSKTPEVVDKNFYFLDGDMVTAQGGQTWHMEGDEWVFTGKDVVSPKTGVHYKFLGWTLYYSSSPLIRQPTIRVNKNALHDVLRSYWGSVK